MNEMNKKNMQACQFSLLKYKACVVTITYAYYYNMDNDDLSLMRRKTFQSVKCLYKKNPT